MVCINQLPRGYGLSICLSPKIHMSKALTPNVMGFGHGAFERFGQGHEDGTLILGLVPL